MFLHTKLENTNHEINIAFIGCGKFVSMFLAQYNNLKKINIDSIIDTNIDQAKKNCVKSGLNQKIINKINFSNSLDEILDRNIEIYIEATGNPIIGTVHADKIIKNKKNIILVNVVLRLFALEKVLSITQHLNILHPIQFGNIMV